MKDHNVRWRNAARIWGCALFLGGAETMLGMDIGYERKIGTGCSYYVPLKR